MLISPAPKLQFFDSDGNPLVGGKVYTYLAGTSTPAVTYTDYSGVTPNSNPVIMDSAGLVSIWFSGDLAYKFVIADATDVVLYTTDNINTPQSQWATLLSSGGAALVGYIQGSTGSVATTVQKRLSWHYSIFDFMSDAQIAQVRAGTSTNDTVQVQAAINASAGHVLYVPKGLYKVAGVQVTQPVVMVGDGAADCLFRKVSDSPVFTLLNNLIKFENIGVRGGNDQSFGFTDTTDNIVIGHNDGANGQGSGYIPASQCEFHNVSSDDAGRDNYSWQEGPFLVFNNAHGNNAKRHGFYVSDKSFDTSHGDWFTSAAGSESDDYSINNGCHYFRMLKSFSAGARGVYLNNTRGTVGNIFVELSTGAFLELTADTLACNINVEFWTTGKNYIDQGIGNRVTGMSLGNNSGALFQSNTNTNRLLIKREFVQVGDPILLGGLMVRQDTNNLFEIGAPDADYTPKLSANSGGVSLQQIGCHAKIQDLSSFGSTVDLSVDNQHVTVFLLAPTQTVRLNAAGGTGYVPFDGQTVTIMLTSTGTVNINGKIDGTLQTEALTGNNVTRTYIWSEILDFWFNLRKV